MRLTITLDDISVVRKAHIYAMAAHAAVGQLRKYTNEPYIVHPVEVASIVADVDGVTEEMIAAAFLHDTMEDTGCTFTDIHMAFGIDIAIFVRWLTDVAVPADGNRATRAMINAAHIADAPAAAQTVKCADIISNVRSIASHDPTFSKVYLPEKIAVLDVLTKADANLRAHAYAIIAAAMSSI